MGLFGLSFTSDKEAAERRADRAIDAASAAIEAARMSIMQNDFDKKMKDQADEHRKTLQDIMTKNAEDQKKALEQHAKASEKALADQKTAFIKEAKAREEDVKKEIDTMKVYYEISIDLKFLEKHGRQLPGAKEENG